MEEALYLHVAEHGAVCERVLEAGGCARCALRYSAPPWSAYELSADFVRSALVSALGVEAVGCENEEATGTCRLCLGAMDSATAAAVAASAIRHTSVGDVVSWKVCVSCPIASLVRDAALSGLLGWSKSNAHSVKDAMRFVVRGDLSRLKLHALEGKPCVLGGLGGIEFELKFEYDASAEVSALPDRVRPALPRRPRLKFHERGKRARAPQPGPSEIPWSQIHSALSALDSSETAALGAWFASTVMPVRATPTAVCKRGPTYIIFSYRKLNRIMPQSPWIVDGVVKGTASVEEVVSTAVRQVADCDGVKFAASGREDCDVRMLGFGRPAYIELENCRGFTIDSNVAVALAAAAANRSRILDAPIDILGAKLADRMEVNAINASAMTKVKTYACVVWCSRDLGDTDVAKCDLRDLDIFQKTPIRVMHSRSLSTRIKRVHELRLRLLNKHFAVLTIVTSAGMYIKEFVHGDLGRTKPSLASLLGAPTDILQLDVLHVEDNAAFESAPTMLSSEECREDEHSSAN